MSMPSMRHGRGFALIEILVAVFVLAFGLLGVTGMQLNALKNNQSAEQRSQASILAYFMLDAMRANREAAESGGYNLGETGAPDRPVCTTPALDGTLAAHDQATWMRALKSNMGDLKSTCGLIACTASICTIKIFWDDKRGTRGGPQLVEIRSRL